MERQPVLDKAKGIGNRILDSNIADTVVVAVLEIPRVIKKYIAPKSTEPKE